MPKSWRKFLIGLALFIGAGAGVGYLYGRPDWGLLVAALLALLWHVRQLLAFDRALRTRDFDAFRFGDGIWQQIFSRFSFEHVAARDPQVHQCDAGRRGGHRRRPSNCHV